MELGFNSSDDEEDVQSVPSKLAHLGNVSMVAMWDARFDDRLASKKRLRNMEDTRGK